MDDVNFYIAFDRELIPYITIISVLIHEKDTDVCNTWFSLEMVDEIGTVHSLSNEESTPDELSEKAEIVSNALDESGVLLANASLLSCERFSRFLQDYNLRN